ncbi:MAG: FAD-dependent oxidoreductase [Leptospira sp.]|nr:FAD-dependent oxidoreductase [Leptospira sp.]
MNQKQLFSHDYTILGAGISGLTLARSLKAKGKDVLLLEKSKGLGGRMATRRIGDLRYDHGAQFLRDDGDAFQRLSKLVQNQSPFLPWFQNDVGSYLCGKTGMTFIAQALGEDLLIERETKVTRLHPFSDHIEIRTDGEKIIRTNHLILTSPLPQSLELLETSQISYPQALKEIRYAKALVLLFEVEAPSSQLQKMNFEVNPSETIASISNQKLKGIAPRDCFTLIMNPIFSESQFGEEEDAVIEKIKAELSHLFSEIIQIKNPQLKRWKYSHPFTTYPAMSLALPEENRIILVGDGFGGGSILGALRSAFHTIDEML